jgi:hypothetical protein
LTKIDEVFNGSLVLSVLIIELSEFAIGPLYELYVLVREAKTSSKLALDH